MTIHPVALDLAAAQETPGTGSVHPAEQEAAEGAGRGEVFFADMGKEIQVMYLEDDSVSVVQMTIKSDVNLKTFVGKGSDETFQMGFGGTGWGMIQPSEAAPASGGNGTGIGL